MGALVWASSAAFRLHSKPTASVSRGRSADHERPVIRAWRAVRVRGIPPQGNCPSTPRFRDFKLALARRNVRAEWLVAQPLGLWRKTEAPGKSARRRAVLALRRG